MIIIILIKRLAAKKLFGSKKKLFGSKKRDDSKKKFIQKKN
jgi:hypothetical protein